MTKWTGEVITDTVVALRARDVYDRCEFENVIFVQPSPEARATILESRFTGCDLTDISAIRMEGCSLIRCALPPTMPNPWLTIDLGRRRDHRDHRSARGFGGSSIIGAYDRLSPTIARAVFSVAASGASVIHKKRLTLPMPSPVTGEF